RFTGQVLTDVNVGPSPRWLASRLTLAGMRSINNVVDVSNYVMLELGQPNHPYDLARLAGGGLLIRRARKDETVTTLDGVERAVGRFCALAAEATGARPAGGLVDVQGRLPRPARPLVRTRRVNAVLGTDLGAARIRTYLEPIGFTCAPGRGGWRVTVPSWRPD